MITQSYFKGKSLPFILLSQNIFYTCQNFEPINSQILIMDPPLKATFCFFILFLFFVCFPFFLVSLLFLLIPKIRKCGENFYLGFHLLKFLLNIILVFFANRTNSSKSSCKIHYITLILLLKVKVKSLSRVWLLETPWAVAYQDPQSMEFSRQECWSGSPFPSPGDLPNSGIEPGSPALQADALPSEPL